MDLAEGHVKALGWFEEEGCGGYGKLSVFNLGTGKGYSVLEMVRAMEKASGKEIKYKIGSRREGGELAERGGGGGGEDGKKDPK